MLESYFKLETPLYFSYTHLVCRSAIEGECFTMKSQRFGLALVYSAPSTRNKLQKDWKWLF